MNKTKMITPFWQAALVAGSAMLGSLVSAQNIAYDDLKKNMVLDDAPVKNVNGLIGSYAPIVDLAAPAVVTIYSNVDLRAQLSRRAPGGIDPGPGGGLLEEMLRRMLEEQFGGRSPVDPTPRQAPQRPPRGNNNDEDRGNLQRMGLGSGVILTQDGYILTNNHVIDKADEITVQIKDDRKEFAARVIGRDPETDVALIKIDATGLTPIRVADSGKVRVGDVVLAVGNPLGLEQTVTHGIVSAVGRRNTNITGYENFIQTDASVNVGNSGGALIDIEGRLIGINTAIKTDGMSRGNVGIAFAIPTNMAMNVVRKLIEGGGKVHRGFLGINLEDLNQEKATQLGRENQRGALVAKVNPGTPAAVANFQADDLIIGLSGQPIEDSAQLRNGVSAMDPGDEVEFTIVRNGQERQMSVVLGDKDELMGKIDPRVGGKGGPPQQGGSIQFIDGVKIRDLDPNLRSALKIGDKVNGALVDSVEEGTDANQHGLQAGQIITMVDQTNVSSAAEAKQIAEQFDGAVLLIQVFKNGERSIKAVPMR